jgi:DnaJ family protein A protein 2
MKWTWIASVVLVLLLVAVDALREDADSSQYESANFYEIFGLDSASFKKDALRRAYHKLAKKYHPDKNPENADALKKFQRITHAFEILEDDDKRRNYDLYGEAGSQSGFDSDGSGAQAIFERYSTDVVIG